MRRCRLGGTRCRKQTGREETSHGTKLPWHDARDKARRNDVGKGSMDILGKVQEAGKEGIVDRGRKVRARHGRCSGLGYIVHACDRPLREFALEPCYGTEQWLYINAQPPKQLSRWKPRDRHKLACGCEGGPTRERIRFQLAVDSWTFSPLKIRLRVPKLLTC